MILNLHWYKRTGLVICSILCVSMMGCSDKDEKKETDIGYDYILTQEYQNALEHFNIALQKGENQENLYRGMGLAYMGKKEYGKAVDSFKSALSCAGMFPGDLEYDINNYMAISYYKLEDFESAIKVYDGIIGMKPKDATAYFMRGTMELDKDDIENALLDFDKATEIKKNDYGQYIDVYACLKEHGHEAEGQKYIDVVMSADSADINDYDKGRLCYYRGDFAQGCNYLERAKELDATNLEVISLLSDCYKQTGQYEYAAVVYSSYLANKEDPDVYNRLGLCYIEQGDYSSALNAFQAGIAITENNTSMQTLMLNEVICYEHLGDFKTAKEKLSEYMSVYSADEIVKKEYAFLTTR